MKEQFHGNINMHETHYRPVLIRIYSIDLQYLFFVEAYLCPRETAWQSFQTIDFYTFR